MYAECRAAMGESYLERAIARAARDGDCKAEPQDHQDALETSAHRLHQPLMLYSGDMYPLLRDQRAAGGTGSSVPAQVPDFSGGRIASVRSRPVRLGAVRTRPWARYLSKSTWSIRYLPYPDLTQPLRSSPERVVLYQTAP